MNSITIQFARGGFILTVSDDGYQTDDVFVSTGKLNKAVRDAVARLSLLPKKADDEADE